jgi:hypothetical protein
MTNELPLLGGTIREEPKGLRPQKSDLPPSFCGETPGQRCLICNQLQFSAEELQTPTTCLSAEEWIFSDSVLQGW